MTSSLIVFVGAGIGGMLRHVLNVWATRLLGLEFPIGILIINVLGSSAMGFAAGWLAFKGHAAQEVRLFLTTGILGGFTTFSSFTLDAALLYERGEIGQAALYVAASVILSLAGLYVGLWIMRVSSP